MRLNQYISHNSNFSRREADELIKAGKVRVGRSIITDLATQIDENDKKTFVFVNGRKITPKDGYTAIIYHKPKGKIVSKKDERGRDTIYSDLPNGFAHFRSVGRLDFASSGLLVLTDSPKVVRALEKSDLEREYYVKIKGKPSEALFEAMRNGLVAKDATKGAHAKTKIKSMEFAPFLAFSVIGTSGIYTRLKVIIKEGQNRELRRFFGYFDLPVMDLKRVAFGVLSLDTLKESKWRYFSASEYSALKDFLKDEK